MVDERSNSQELPAVKMEHIWIYFNRLVGYNPI